MISKRDVIRMKVPYPTMHDTLAVSAHMYICIGTENSKREFVKCQTLKPYMLVNNTMLHYWDERADINRNPFQRTTRIDCDKTFYSDGVQYDLKLRTTSRPDICESLLAEVERKVDWDGCGKVLMNQRELLQLNSLIYSV